MPGLSHWHHRCNAKQCQASICMLRWQARPLPCPPCQSPPRGPWSPSQYRPGCQRYRCPRCQRTCNDLPAPWRHRSQRPRADWLLATFLVGLACAARRLTRELGIQSWPSYRWGWWLRNAAVA